MAAELFDVKAVQCIRCKSRQIERVKGTRTHVKCKDCGKVFEPLAHRTDGNSAWIDPGR